MTELPKQFKYIEKAEKATFVWAKDNNIKLYKIEFIVPFLLEDKSLCVYLFFETDNILDIYSKDGTEERVKEYYLKSLREMSYPNDYLDQIEFIIDSNENVQTNYDGSYFARLR